MRDVEKWGAVAFLLFVVLAYGIAFWVWRTTFAECKDFGHSTLYCAVRR